MRINSGNIAILFILSLLPFGESLGRDTLHVRNQGPLTSLTAAVAAGKPGDLILVHPGRYMEGGVVVDKSLHIKGINLPVIDGTGVESDILIITADDVIVEGLQIQHVQTNYIKDLAGINVQRARRCIIRNNKLIDTFFGIYMQRTSAGRVYNNEVLGQAKNEVSSGNALHLWYCKNMELTGNRLTGHRDGIYLEFTDSTYIKNNVSEGNLRYGLHFMFANNNDYEKNEFRNNGAGVAVMFSRNITMIENLFVDNWGAASYGLLLKEIYDGEIAGNVFRQNTVGIYGESASRLRIANNDFENNGWALKVLGSCMDNAITRNNFIANTFDVATNSSRSHNEYAENYWSGYSGYDLDRDGKGDVPYQPVKLFSYLTERIPESIILHRSLFIDMINFAEKVMPVLTPHDLKDERPLMKRIKR